MQNLMLKQFSQKFDADFDLKLSVEIENKLFFQGTNVFMRKYFKELRAKNIRRTKFSYAITGVEDSE